MKRGFLKSRLAILYKSKGSVSWRQSRTKWLDVCELIPHVQRSRSSNGFPFRMIESFRIPSGDLSILNKIVRQFLNPGLILLHGLNLSKKEMVSLIRRELDECSVAVGVRGYKDEEEIERDGRKAYTGREPTRRQICTLIFATFVLTFFQSWLQHLTKVNIYYLHSLLQSIFTLLIAHLMPWKATKISKDNILSFWREKRKLSLIILQSVIFAFIGNYWKQTVTNGHCPDFYELFLVASVPSTILWMQCKLNQADISKAGYLILAISAVKLYILCASPTFMMQTSTALSCFVLSTVYGLFLVALSAYLKKALMEFFISSMQLKAYTKQVSFAYRNNIFPALQSLIFWKIPLLFALVLFHGELQSINEFSFVREAVLLLVMALITLVKLTSMFLLLKHSDPLSYVVAANLFWVPMTLVRSFIFKYLFFVSSFKLLWFIALDFVLLVFKKKLNQLFEITSKVM